MKKTTKHTSRTPQKTTPRRVRFDDTGNELKPSRYNKIDRALIMEAKQLDEQFADAQVKAPQSYGYSQLVSSPKLSFDEDNSGYTLRFAKNHNIEQVTIVTRDGHLLEYNTE